MKHLITIFNILSLPFLCLKYLSLPQSLSLRSAQGYRKEKKLLFAFLGFFILFNLNSYAEDEKGNTCDVAQALLTLGLYASSDVGSSSSGDKDFFSFDVPDNGELNITIYNADNNQGLAYSSIMTACPATTTPTVGTLIKGLSETISISSTSATKYYIYVEGLKRNATDYNISALFTPNKPTKGVNLKITKTGSVDTVLIYNPFYYTINVSNIGDENASNVEVKDFLPTRMSVNLTATNEDSPGWTCSGTTIITCKYDGNLTVGSLSTMKLHVKAPPIVPTVGFITNKVSVTADDYSSDENVTETTTVTADIDTAEKLCYVDTTPLLNDDHNTSCEIKGNFYYGSGCDAYVTVRENNETDIILSDVTVNKMYAPDTSSGTCDFNATSTGPSRTGTCSPVSNSIDFGSYQDGYSIRLGPTGDTTTYDKNVSEIEIKIHDFGTDNKPRIDGVAIFGDYLSEEIAADGTHLSFHHTGRVFECSGLSEGGITINSSADVIDTPIITADDVAAYNDGTLKFIRTMIASSAQTITGVHLNLDGEATPFDFNGTAKNYSPYAIIPYLYNDDCTARLEKNIWSDGPDGKDQLVIEIHGGNYSATSTMYVPRTAREVARLRLIFADPNTLSPEGQQCLANSSTTGNFARLAQCVNSEIQYKTAFGQDAWDRCGIANGKPCLSSNHGYSCGEDDTSCQDYNELYDDEIGCYTCTFDIQPICSTDNFAIRPDTYDVNITDGDIFIAGKPTSLAFKALDGATATAPVPTPGYNEVQGDSFSVDANVTNSANCEVKNLKIDPPVVFIDGEGEAPGLYSFDDIGDANFSIHENIGNEFAIVDANDTNDSLRLITPLKRNIKVIPFDFNITATLADHNDAAHLTYLHDINRYGSEDNHSMGAELNISIQAMGADDNITHNYTEGCYAKDTNLTLILSGTDITYPGSAAPLTHFLYYNPAEDNGSADSGEGNYTLPAPAGNTISFTSLPIENIAATFPARTLPDKNGTTEIQYKLNFDRKIHLVVNPVRLALSNVNIIDTDGVTGETNATDQNATFYYARSRASKFFYDDITDPTADTPILVDVYSDLGFTASSDLGIDTVGGQINEINWWLSTGHRETLGDGNITLTINLPTAIKEGEKSDTPAVDTDVNVESQGQDNSIEVTSNASVLSMKVEIDLDTNTTKTNRWLIHNAETDDTIQAPPSPFYKVRFIGQNDWAGHGDTGHVVDSPTSYKKNRRLEW